MTFISTAAMRIALFVAFSCWDYLIRSGGGSLKLGGGGNTQRMSLAPSEGEERQERMDRQYRCELKFRVVT